MKVLTHHIAGEVVTINVATSHEDGHAFLEWLNEGHRVVALDAETTGLGIYSPAFGTRLVQFGDRSVAWVLRADLHRPFIVDALSRPTQHFIIHNAQYDALVLDRTGFITLEDLLPRVFDTRILAHLNDPRGKMEGGTGLGLKDLSAVFVDATAPDTSEGLTAVFRSEYKATKATGWAVIDIDHPTYVLYAGLDVILLARLFEVLAPLIRDKGLGRLSTFEHAVMGVCARMVRRGFRLDVAYTERLADELQERSLAARKRAATWGVANVDSPKQVAEALQGMGWTPREFTPGGSPKVDKAVLDALVAQGNPLAKEVQEAKRAAKWRESYAVAMLEGRDANDRVHPDVAALQARTARMSISRPPLQQLPSKDWTVRRALAADPGYVIGGVDYQAVEMRVLAALADVKKMKAAIAAGEDLHGFTARLVYGDDFTPFQRGLMKGVGFGKVYGGGAETLSRQTGAPIDAVKRAVAEYDAVYPEVRRYSKRLQERAQWGGREVITPSGRHLPLDRDRLYAATNYVVQSTARDLLAQALVDLEEAGLGEYLLLPVHDEVIFQAPADEAQDVARAIAKAMETDDFFGVPIEADPDVYGPTWGHGYGCKPDASGVCQNADPAHPRKIGVTHP